MPKYKNLEELNSVINEGYFNKPTYDSIGYREILLEKVLNIAKNNKDDIFRQISILVEEIDMIEKEADLKVEDHIKEVGNDNDQKQWLVDDLPLTTLAIKKLDAENIESLKWILVKKLQDKNIGFNQEDVMKLDDTEFKKYLTLILCGHTDLKADMKEVERDFAAEAKENKTVEALVESFVLIAGKRINEDHSETVEQDDNDYFYLLKKQLDVVFPIITNKHIGDAMEKIETINEELESNPIDMFDELPEEIKLDTATEFVLRSDDEPETDEAEEDTSFTEIVDADDELETEQLTVDEQIERQEGILESLKELYIINRSREIVMLESGKILKGIEAKKNKLNRTLVLEQMESENTNSEYGTKLTKLGILVESLFRKYISELTAE